MSQILTQSTTPLWKQGRNSNIEFLSNWKRLEREDPETYKIVQQREGFSCQNGEFEYKVGVNKFGLWLSRRRLGLEGFHDIESRETNATKDTVPARPQMTENLELTQEEIAILKQFFSMIKLMGK